MNCPRCQQENPPQAKFCLGCATPLVLRCANCGTHLPTAAKFCFECATPISTPGSPPRLASPDAYTPKHLAERIINSKTALEGERKQVTVLFADLKGSLELLADRDPEEARKLLDPVIEHMMEAVHRYEGTVNQVMGDGIMALFGAPLAHEDHGVRACYAALRMQESVKQYSEGVRRSHGIEVQIRVGLNSGEVVVRSIGSDLRMDYTAVGQTTHLAARMEQLASPGTTRLTGETLRLAEGYVEVKPLGPIPVKGLNEPIEIFELVGALAIRTRFEAARARGLTRFVGRDAEIDQLSRALRLASGGHGQIAAVVGEAGVGKSRLLYEFTRSHRAQGWLVLESASVSYGRATSYLPVIELLKGYFKIQDQDDAREIREKVTGKVLTLDESLRAALPALLALLEVPVEGSTWRALDPAQRRQRTLDAVKRLLLREAQEQPIVLIFEDLHWIDSETQALLDVLAESVGSARVLLLVNYRPEYQHTWGGKTYYSQMRLDTLPPESAEQLLDVLLGKGAGLERLKKLLVRRGNPFFLEETVRALAETGALVGDLGHYRLTQAIQSIEIPRTVQAILAARIDRLSPAVKHLMQSAAVVGKDVPFALLAAIADQPEEALLRGLAQLQAAEFLYEKSLFPEPEYTFKHALTLEVAYHSVLRERRRSLHERVLATLERQWAGRETEKIELFAHHASRAELWDRASRYLYQAGERAFAHGRYQVGIGFFQTAVEALDRLGDAADLTLKLDACLELWSAWLTLHDYEGLGDLGDKAAALARSLNDGPRLAQVQVRQAQAVAYSCVIPGTLESGIEKAREAFDRADAGDVRTRSYAQFIIGHAYRELGWITEAVREFGTGIALFDALERYGREPGLVFPIYVSLRAWCSEAHATLGDFDQALTSAREALRVATDIHHLNSLGVASAYLGYVHVLRGEFERSLPFLERALTIATEQSLPRRPDEASPYLAYAFALLGRSQECLQCLARTAPSSTGAKPPWYGYGAMRARAYLAVGCRDEAYAEVRHGLAAASERNARGYRGPLLRLEAELLAHTDPVTARQQFEEALALANGLGMRPLVADCHVGLARVARRSGKRDDASHHFQTAIALYCAMGMTYWLEKAEAEMAELA